MSAQASNLEEAANVAAEFIYNIDNLPHEVNHILQEIKIRETKVQELQQEIDRDTVKYIRHYRRSSAVSPSPSSPTSKSNSREQTPSGTSSSTAQIPAKVNSLYTQLSDLANEKCLLAERLIELILRTRSKLDAELGKVKILQGEASEAVAVSNSTEMIAPALALAMAQSPAGTGYGLSQANQASLFGVGNGLGRSASVDSNAFALNAGGRNPALAISESLRNALSMASPGVSLSAPVVAASSTPASTVTATSGHATKKRKLAASASGTIKISTAGSHSNRNSRSSSPAVTIPAVTQTKKSSRSSRLRERVEEDEEEEEAADEVAMDTEGVGELDDDAEDETLYCFCQKQSYGDMIACDNEGGCPFEWFHLACVGLKQPTPEKWYCSVCTKEMGLSTSTPGATVGRKGRKK